MASMSARVGSTFTPPLLPPRPGLPEDRRHSYVFRHSIGVHMANEGFEIPDVGGHSGHADLTSNGGRLRDHRQAPRSDTPAHADIP